MKVCGHARRTVTWVFETNAKQEILILIISFIYNAHTLKKHIH